MLVDVVVVVVNRTSLRPIISFPTEHLNQSDEEQKKRSSEYINTRKIKHRRRERKEKKEKEEIHLNLIVSLKIL